MHLIQHSNQQNLFMLELNLLTQTNIQKLLQNTEQVILLLIITDLIIVLTELNGNILQQEHHQTDYQTIQIII